MKSILPSRKKLVAPLLLALLVASFFVGCSVQNNSATTRFYHNLTTRYNVYYNGNNAFQEAYKKQLTEAPDNLAERIMIEPIVGVSKEALLDSKGPFDQAIEKGQKAIRLHSIRSKPSGKKRNTPFYQKREYNTFIHNAWLLVGKSQYHNGNFLDAMATFSYMARLYKEEPNIKDIARLWQARCYLALEWTDDAARIIASTRADSPIAKSALYGKTEADLAIQEGRYRDAIPMLEQAIRKEKSKLARIRLRFLKGQLESESGLAKDAQRSFSKVIASAPAFPIEVTARLNIISLDAETQPKEALKKLNKMLRKERYSQVIDKVALSKGRILLAQKDTIPAIEAFSLGAEKSQQKAYEYALCRIALAEIFLAKGKFVKAAKELSAGLSALRENYPHYAELKRLSEQMDELSRHAMVVDEQDSLRHLASMPEVERLHIIDSAITAYKKQIKEQGREELLAEQQERQNAFNQEVGNNRTTNPSFTPSVQVSDKSFYFYNNDLLALGKSSFIKLWGNRPLEDDWRRKNKRVAVGVQSNLSDVPIVPEKNSDSLAIETSDPSLEKSDTPSTDNSQNPEKREYYLALLPFSPEAIDASDKLIQGGLEGMGSVLNEKMERFPDAIAVYKDLLNRYPSYQERKSVYYKLFMIFERLGDKAEATFWRNKMQADFPSDPLTKEVTNPGYIESLKKQDSIENNLYARALEAYFHNNNSEAKKLSQDLLSQYALSSLRPKTLFLLSLTQAAEGLTDDFKQTLKQILEESPNSEMSEVAEPILSDLAKGRKIMKEGYSGIDFGAIFSSQEDSTSSSSLSFKLPEFGESYMALLLFPHESVNLNELLFAVAGFNFSQFTNYNLTFTLQKSFEYDRLVIEGLPSIRVAREYLQKAYAPQGYMSLLDNSAWLIPISKPNYATIEKGLPLGDYINFLSDSLLVYIPEASMPLEAIDALAQETPQKRSIEENKHSQSTSSSQESKSSPKSTEIKRSEQGSSQTKLDKAKRISSPLSKEPPHIPELKVDSVITIDTIVQQKTDSLSHTTQRKDSSLLHSDSITPGQMTLNDAKLQRELRLKEQKVKEREERVKRQEAEKVRQETLRLREKERIEREKKRVEEQKKRERERKEAQREREKKRKEAQRERNKNRATQRKVS